MIETIFLILMTAGPDKKVEHIAQVPDVATCQALLGEISNRVGDTGNVTNPKYFYGCIKVQDGKVYHPSTKPSGASR